MTNRRKAILSTFGRAVRQAREKQGLSQAAVARDANISQGALSMIELGTRGPSIVVAVLLAETLGISLSATFAYQRAPLTLRSRANTHPREWDSY